MELLEIYTELANHMLKGVMMHEELANYYDFLSLKGYKKCHEYHFWEEMGEYRKLCSYVINHHNMLIPEVTPNDPEVMPKNWYYHTQQEVDSSTRKTGVRTGLTRWVDWETETKHLYERAYKQFMEIDAVADACRMKCLIKNVDRELKKAQHYKLVKDTLGYNLEQIMAEQHGKKEKYKEKIKWWSERIC